ncbi:hypothetical protein GCM10009430_27990 [Aquimarina litoralis]|uniref:DUF4280 domain-containing protein n=1 Tax=Aquimarina litoralis TaxID=584605 RepID=A0ABP3U4I0_9FLAO
MSTGHVVVDGAMCKCKFGTTPDTLVVLTQQKEYINDSGGSKKLIANTMDIGMPLKAKTFGQCKLQPSSSGYLPCVPAITQWQDFYDKVILSNQGQILTEKSKAMCAISGSPSVEFTWHGQTAAAGSSSVEQADEEVQSQLNPLVNVKKMVESLDNDLEVEEENWVRNEEERVVSVTTDLYIKSTDDLKTPRLNSKDQLLFESSKPFISGLKAIFGDDIKHPVLKEFKQNLEKGAIPPPSWEVDRSLSDNRGGYYTDKTIYLNENLVLKAEQDPEACWLLFRVMIEETGHYIDDLLRNEYDNIGGDAAGDEGTLFAADFVIYNQLLFKDFQFASFKIKGADGSIRDFEAKVLTSSPNKDKKGKDLVYVEDKSDDHGTITLKNGEQREVEFFKIEGGGAVHESITKQAAEIASKRLNCKIYFDEKLDKGVAWPDVPCGNENSVETCYGDMLYVMALNKTKTSRKWIDKNSIVYKSHFGEYQFWHSMAPPGDFTNQEVVDKIVEQAKEWYTKAQEVEKANKDKAKQLNLYHYYGLFHVGKILHMVQDSYSASHVHRDEKTGGILQIQSYTEQDEHKHGEPDKADPHGHSKPITRAIEASASILVLFGNGRSSDELEKYLRNTVYKFGVDKKGVNTANKKAGGSLEEFKPDPE